MPLATKAQQREYQRAWMAARRAAFFAGKSCARCGAPDNLHLHHRDPAKKVGHQVWSWREERRERELAQRAREAGVVIVALIGDQPPRIQEDAA